MLAQKRHGQIVAARRRQLPDHIRIGTAKAAERDDVDAVTMRFSPSAWQPRTTAVKTVDVGIAVIVFTRSRISKSDPGPLYERNNSPVTIRKSSGERARSRTRSANISSARWNSSSVYLPTFRVRPSIRIPGGKTL